MTTPISIDQMHADLNITFPGIHLEPLDPAGAVANLTGIREGLWTQKDERQVMSGGGQILVDATVAGRQVDGTVHEAFTAWLFRRGWGCAWWEGIAFLVFPLFAPGYPQAGRDARHAEHGLRSVHRICGLETAATRCLIAGGTS